MQPLLFWPEAIVVTNQIPAGRLHPGLQRDQSGLVFFLVISFLCTISSSGWRLEMEDAMAKFFTYEERLMLQRLLKEGMSFKKIAAQIH